MRKVTSLMLVLALGCWAGPGRPSKLSADVQSQTNKATVRVIVQWNGPVGPDTQNKVLALGGSVVAEYQALHSGTYVIPASALSALEADDTVVYVSPDRSVHHKLALTAAAINASAAWNAGYKGTGIGIAVIDSGITNEKDIGAAGGGIVYAADFTGSKSGTATNDMFGHGEHVAGIIASNGWSSTCNSCKQQFTGIAPGANLINLRVLDGNGQGTDSQVIAAINQAISLKSKYNIRVMNLSLGRPVFESYTQDPLCQAVEAAWKAGIVVVVAAGNDGRDNTYGTQGYGTILAPGNDPYVITVGP